MKRKLSLLAPKPGSRAAIRQSIERPIVRTIDRTADGDLGDRPQYRQSAGERGVIGDCRKGASKPHYKLTHRNSARVLAGERVWRDEIARWVSDTPSRVNPRYRLIPSKEATTSASGHIIGQWPIGEIHGSTHSRVIPAREWTADQLRRFRSLAALAITNEHAAITGDILAARAIVAEIDSRPERQRQAQDVSAARSRLKREAIKDAAFNATDHALVSRILTNTAPPSIAPASGIVARFRFQSVPAGAPEFAYTPRVPLASLVPLARPKVMAAGRY